MHFGFLLQDRDIFVTKLSCPLTVSWVFAKIKRERERERSEAHAVKIIYILCRCDMHVKLT